MFHPHFSKLSNCLKNGPVGAPSSSTTSLVSRREILQSAGAFGLAFTPVSLVSIPQLLIPSAYMQKPSIRILARDIAQQPIKNLQVLVYGLGKSVASGVHSKDVVFTSDSGFANLTVADAGIYLVGAFHEGSWTSQRLVLRAGETQTASLFFHPTLRVPSDETRGSLDVHATSGGACVPATAVALKNGVTQDDIDTVACPLGYCTLTVWYPNTYLVICSHGGQTGQKMIYINDDPWSVDVPIS